MADEARLNELLDLVEQSRKEGDKETEAKATAAYKRESAPATPAPPTAIPVQNKPPEIPEPTWGQAIKNVAQAGAHAATGYVGSVAGNVAGLASLLAPPAMIARKMGYEGGVLDPANVRNKVSSALTYTPDNTDTASMQIADAIPNALHWTGQQLKKPVEGVPYLETLAENLPEVAANAMQIKVARVVGRASVPKEVIPTTEQLGKAATAAYKRADDAGIAVSAESFEGMKAKLSDALGKDGIDADLHPNATAALKRVTAETGPVSLQKLETLRRIALDAEDTLVKADARKAGEIVDTIDDYVDNLSDTELTTGKAKDAVALKEARALYTRKRKAEDIDRLIRRAEYSPSGFENGLRIEFRTLAKNDRRFNRFSAEEKAAIDKVAKGGVTENALRLLGKAAPTGIVSGGLSSGAGFAFGGPIGAVALPAAGIAGRIGSKALTSRNARLASETMRRGPPQAPVPRVQTPTAAPLTGELMPRKPLALPAPNIISGSRSSPGTAYAREQMGITPDVERAGALHPGMAHTAIPKRPLALPYLPEEAAVPGAMVVDQHGRAAPSAAQLQEYLRNTGQDRLGNVRQPSANPQPGLLADTTAPSTHGLLGRSTRSVREIQADVRHLQEKARGLSREQLADSSYMRALSMEWERLQSELKQRGSRAVSP